jgi:lipopolysaccharide biosynthesis protein
VLIYRADIIPDVAATIRRWRARAREIGIGELHLRATTAFGYSEYAAAGFDGIADFPPHAIRSGEINGRLVLTNVNYGGLVYDYPTVADQKIAELALIEDPRHAPGVMPGWDNEPRKPGLGNVFHNADPQSYFRWLEAACAHATSAGGQGLVFINAWNEWAEGAYLEPDRWFGHGYLHATREAMAAYASKLAPEAGRVYSDGAFSPSRPTLILHLYYSDLIDNFSVRLASLDANLIVTLPDSWSPEALDRAKQAFPTAEIIVMPNRGRDILPFIRALRRARALGADIFCKIHSKKSPHMANGEAWREELLEGLLSETAWREAVERFAGEADLGLLATAASRMSLSDPSVMYHNHSAVNRLSTMLGLHRRPDFFPAGSMFWGRVSALAPLLDLEETLLDFEPELGRIDGTTAHALERLMSAIVESRRFRASYLL